MGRWAQRRRAGGGPNLDVEISMISAETGGSLEEILITYSSDVTAGNFDAGDFTSLPSNETGDNLAQGGSDQLIVAFLNPVDTDTSLNYAGSSPGIQSPQTIART